VPPETVQACGKVLFSASSPPRFPSLSLSSHHFLRAGRLVNLCLLFPFRLLDVCPRYISTRASSALVTTLWRFRCKRSFQAALPSRTRLFFFDDNCSQHVIPLLPTSSFCSGCLEDFAYLAYHIGFYWVPDLWFFIPR